jgi:hypothetical protein
LPRTPACPWRTRCANGNPSEPIVSRNDSFAFDTFTPEEGLKLGFVYRRIEQANYDRKATLHGLPRATGFAIVACETLGEFRRRSNALLGAAATRRDFAMAGEGAALHA